MFVIRLSNGNLIAPESAVDPDGRVVGDAYVELGPADPEYARLAQQAVSEQELEDRRRQWREGDEALRRQFEMFRAGQDRAGQDRAGEDGAGEDGAGEDRAGEDRAGEDGAGEDGAGEDRAGEDRAGEARAGEARADGD